MAFTKTPTGDSYKTEVVPLTVKWDQRYPNYSYEGLTPDAWHANVIPEPVMSKQTNEQIYHMYKRWGCTFPTDQVEPDQPTGQIKGMYPHLYLNPYTVVVATTGTSLYQTTGYTWSSTAGMTDGTPIFTSFAYDNGDISTIWGTHLGVLYEVKNLSTPNSLGTIDPRYSPVALDGYVFTHDGQNNIYNSNLNDPNTWSTSNFISVEGYPCRILRLARSGTYILALTDQSVEFFYDAANPTGSPLAVYQGATQRIRYLGGAVEYQNSVYFIGRAPGGAPSLYRADGLKITPIVDISISRELSDSVAFAASSIGNILHLNGHSIYNLYLPDDSDPTNDNSLSYDLDTGMFLRVAPQLTPAIRGIQAASQDRITGFTYFAPVPVSGTGNRFYRFSSTAYQDDGTSFECFVSTPIYDFGSRRNKFFSRALAITDVETPADVNSISQLTWESEAQGTSGSVDLDLSYDMPAAHSLGRSRALRFTLSYTGDAPMRFEGIEVDYQIGGS